MPNNPTNTRLSRLDVDAIRDDFPLLQRRPEAEQIVYLDNASTTHKPEIVLAAERGFYEADNANVHRGIHRLSQRATKRYDHARERIQQFLNARHSAEIIFTRGTTEAINLVASSYGRANIEPGHEIVISAMEHHSNIVPWQLLCEETGAILRIAPMDERGKLRLNALQALLGPKTKIVSVAHVSNALGTVNPIKEIVDMAHKCNAVVLVDGAQAVAHHQVDVQDLSCDFYAFSGHKLYAPMGIGVLFVKRALLEAMPPYQGGGEMITSVTFEKTTFAQPPFRFEAGTPNVAGAIALAAAIDYVDTIGLEAISDHEETLLTRAHRLLEKLPHVRIIGKTKPRASLVSFVVDGIHAHDVGTILDAEGVAVRTGHHCAQPVMDFFGIPATVRASFGVYNTVDDVDALIRGVSKALEVFS